MVLWVVFRIMPAGIMFMGIYNLARFSFSFISITTTDRKRCSRKIGSFKKKNKKNKNVHVAFLWKKSQKYLACLRNDQASKRNRMNKREREKVRAFFLLWNFVSGLFLLLLLLFFFSTWKCFSYCSSFSVGRQSGGGWGISMHATDV